MSQASVGAKGAVRVIPGDGRPATQQGGPYPMGTMALLATVAMLFAAFTAALLVRRTGTDWLPVELPRIVWLNTALLIVSSLALERGRGVLRHGQVHGLVRWISIAGGLGILFLLGQLIAWQSLATSGVFLPSNPHASFFYMLSAVHGAHVLGGLGALAWTLRRARHGAYTSSQHVGLNHASIYWHFVGGVWLYLLIVLSTL